MDLTWAVEGQRGKNTPILAKFGNNKEPVL
jgi:hypothetical protein